MEKLSTRPSKVNRRQSRLVWKAPLDLNASPENSRLYRVASDEKAMNALAENIRRDGILEPLVITRDSFIVSGHRRHLASIMAQLESVPCRVLNQRREDFTDEEFVRLLREFNRQRSKTLDEVIQEAAVDADPEAAWHSLVEERVKRARNGKGHFEIEGEKVRSKISPAKQPMLKAAIRVIESLKDFWALTVRQIHYCLFGDPPLRNTNRPDSLYRNDRQSYQDLCDLLARARISGIVPWDCIKDDTRPVRLWRTHSHVGAFVEEELSDLFGNYWRDLMRSQPDHLEIIVEKNTSLSVVEQVAMKYCIPTTSGRGYSSKEPLHQIASRFEVSGKRNLVLLLLSDFDPDGDAISNSTAKSLRDDFDIDGEKIIPVRVAIRPDQIQKFNLPRSLEAKRTSSGYDRFVEKHGVTYAVELEAMKPQDLQSELDKAIRQHIDVNLFNQEVEREKEEAAKLQGLKRRATAFLTQYEV